MNFGDILQNNLKNHILPNKKMQINDDDDLFESIIAEEDKDKVIENAIRNSMMARGAQDGFDGLVWPLMHKIFNPTNVKEATQKIYGLQGIILKQSPSFFVGWDQRYAILKAQRLVYKETNSPLSSNAGILNFNLLSCHVVPEKTKGNIIESFRILIKNAEKQFIFKGRTQQQTNKWYLAIQNAITRSQGFGKNFGYLAHYPRFWRVCRPLSKKDYLAEQQFRVTAEPGDILLFRGKKDTSVMQRAITMDQYDHVAVVLLNQVGEPLIFEANGGFGVGICPWFKFVQKKWWQQYEIIVYRKLSVTRTAVFHQVIESFVGTNMGKQYNFSLGDYIFQRSSSKDKQHQKYFCSSLVAKLYKKLQLLPGEKSCKQYLPSSFSSEKMKLCSDGKFGHAYLGEESIIVFERENKKL